MYDEEDRTYYVDVPSGNIPVGKRVPFYIREKPYNRTTYKNLVYNAEDSNKKDLTDSVPNVVSSVAIGTTSTQGAPKDPKQEIERNAELDKTPALTPPSTQPTNAPPDDNAPPDVDTKPMEKEIKVLSYVVLNIQNQNKVVQDRLEDALEHSAFWQKQVEFLQGQLKANTENEKIINDLVEKFKNM